MERDPNYLSYHPRPSLEEVRLRLIEAILSTGEPHGYMGSILRSVQDAEVYIYSGKFPTKE